MFYVIRYKTMFVEDCKEFTDYKEARKEYGRQVRNAWRRKTAWNQVQFHASRGDVLERMQYWQGRTCYNIELSLQKPGEGAYLKK